MSTFRVAIVGSGPSGFYAAEALLRSKFAIQVDLFEKLPVPFGLVRFGVAPDHFVLKQVTKIFDRIASMPGFRFVGNVCIGRDIEIEVLRRYYHAIIFACGMEREKRLNIQGENLKGSYSARDFVAWYNGHPDYQGLDLDLTNESAVVIGQGNVALDVARILVKSPLELRKTDIAQAAYETLLKSNVKRVHIVGRRGPVQAKFTNKELREFESLKDCQSLSLEAELRLNRASVIELEKPNNSDISANYQHIKSFAKTDEGINSRQCYFRFHLNPTSICGEKKVVSVEFENTQLQGMPFSQSTVSTGARLKIDCGLVIGCVGYQAKPLTGLPYDPVQRTLKHLLGRLVDKGKTMPGLYATGWVKRGPNGTIGTNRGDSVETVTQLLKDMKGLERRLEPIEKLFEILRLQGSTIVDFNDWKKIDTEEVRRGKKNHKPREKITRITEMLEVISA